MGSCISIKKCNTVDCSLFDAYNMLLQIRSFVKPFLLPFSTSWSRTESQNSWTESLISHNLPILST